MRFRTKTSPIANDSEVDFGHFVNRECHDMIETFSAESWLALRRLESQSDRVACKCGHADVSWENQSHSEATRARTC